MDETCRLRRGEGYGACIDEKQDKRMASKPTLFLVTAARSADCIKGCAGAAIGACLEEITRGWHQESRKRSHVKGFWRAAPQIGGL
ncbi:MAG: hypothetical protein ACLR8L_03330 [Oscillospiraceae bacterium]